MSAGRPREHDRAALLAAFELYIAQTTIPIVAEFAVSQGLHRQQLYEIDELSDAIKLCVSKKEVALEKGALSGDLNCTMAIFSLKQIGWKDAQKIETQALDRNGNPTDPARTWGITFPSGPEINDVGDETTD